jgi:phosphomannomutase
MTERDILIGGEESGGLGVKTHLPERDGIFLGLMLCEMMAVRGKTLGGLVDELTAEYGPHEFSRVDLHVTEREKGAIMKRFSGKVKDLGGYHVTARKDIDGHKFFVDGGWLLVRASGTEPLIRVYAEGDSMSKVDALQAAVARR